VSSIQPELDTLVARHERVIVDLGTGDGRAVLATATAEPGALVIGIDPDAAAMADVSRRAARPIRNGGIPNALFVVAAAESPPPELRGVLGLDDRVAVGLASLVHHDDGAVEALVSVTPRDGIEGAGSPDGTALDRLSAAHGRSGLELVSAAHASVEEVRASRSTWARRLLAAGADRPVWRLSHRRRPSR